MTKTIKTLALVLAVTLAVSALAACTKSTGTTVTEAKQTSINRVEGARRSYDK